MFPSCTLKRLPPSLLLESAATARAINPANHPNERGLAALGLTGVLRPQHIALLTSKWWGNGGVHLSVQFLDITDAALQARILSHMNAWSAYGNVKFSQTNQSGQVRIATAADGYWSYLGTDILHIPAGQPTMNLEAFSMSTPESEYHRVIRHEAGHSLGCVHEHARKEIVARIDVQKALTYFESTQGWTAAEVQAQVLTPLDDSTLTSLPSDVQSIMCYQLPASIMKDNIAVPGGLDINAEDGKLVAQIYPGAVTPPNPPVCPTGQHWDAAQNMCVPDVVPPPPVGNFKARVDAVFAALIKQYAAYPQLVYVFKVAQSYVDRYLTQHPQAQRVALVRDYLGMNDANLGEGHIPPEIAAIIDVAFVEAEKEYPTLAPWLTLVKNVFDSYLAKM